MTCNEEKDKIQF